MVKMKLSTPNALIGMVVGQRITQFQFWKGKDTMRTLRIMIVMLIMASVLTMTYSCKKSEKTPKAPATTKAPSATTTAAMAQTTCPITSSKIDKSVYVDYQGKRVYFCCTDCKAKFNADPAKYIKQMEDKGIVLEKTPK